MLIYFVLTFICSLFVEAFGISEHKVNEHTDVESFDSYCHQGDRNYGSWDRIPPEKKLNNNYKCPVPEFRRLPSRQCCDPRRQSESHHMELQCVHMYICDHVIMVLRQMVKLPSVKFPNCHHQNRLTCGVGQGLLLNKPKAKAHLSLGFGLGPWAVIFNLFSKRPILSSILLNKHPGPQNARAQSVKPVPEPSPLYSGPTHPYSTQKFKD
jgi:hypothetical protein